MPEPAKCDRRAQKIAIVTPRVELQGTVGGAETLLLRYAERLVQQGREVTLLTTCARDHFTWSNELPAGCDRTGPCEIIRFAVDPRDAKVYHQLCLAMARTSSLTPAQEHTWLRNSVHCSDLYAHLRTDGQRYDCILAGPYLFGVVYTAALIHPAKTLLVPCLHDEPFARLALMQTLFHTVHGCLFNSEPEQELAQALYEFPARKGRVVGMGIPDANGRPREEIDRGISGLTPYVLYCGRREGGKGTPLLCDYMHAFRARTERDLKLVFTGSGPIEAPAGLYPHILDLGFVSERKKHAVMAGALAFIHPSMLESFGIVLLEAWMAQCPALVRSGSKVLRWHCRRGQGGLWFANYPEFEEALLLLLDKEGLRDALGRAGKQYVTAHYAWPAVEARLLAAIDSIP